QIGFDKCDVGHARAGIFGVTAIDRATEPAHQCCDLGTDRELASRAGLHQTDAFDAADLCSLGPFASAHVHLGVVETEGLDLDDDVAKLGLRLWQLGVDEAVRTAEFLDDDGTHCVLSRNLIPGGIEVTTSARLSKPHAEPFTVLCTTDVQGMLGCMVFPVDASPLRNERAPFWLRMNNLQTAIPTVTYRLVHWPSFLETPMPAA